MDAPEEAAVPNGESPVTPQVAEVHAAPWLRQLQVMLYKNLITISRRPSILFMMLISSVGSVLLAWAAGQDPSVDFGDVPLTDCGTIDTDYWDSLPWREQDALPKSYNDKWQSGFPVSLMALGPMVHTICVFLLIQSDVQTEMLGILRSLGLRDSVFWISWWCVFLVTSFINALAGGITASILEVHVFEHVYFVGLVLPFLLLNLALTGASFFLAAVCSTTKSGAATWMILLMIVSLWIPHITTTVSLSYGYGIEAPQSTPEGLFWANANTSQIQYIYPDYPDDDNWWQNGDDWWQNNPPELYTCEKPILSKEQGAFYKTEEERLEFPENEWFVGCYFSAGYHQHFWYTKTARRLIMYFFPYTHFTLAWSNMLGYTAMPNRSFRAKHASMSPEELAIESLPIPPNEVNGRGTRLYPQGSTLMTEFEYVDTSYVDAFGNYQWSSLDNCPASSLADYFCESINQCTNTLNPAPTMDTASCRQLFGHLLVLALLYSVLAAYWTQVFPGKNGAPQRFYFFLRPSYWFGNDRFKTEDIGVEIENVRKSYGDNEAVKGVTLRMNPGEVTALLGHNGAGKSTLASIIGCEINATSGDVRVFGQSVNTNASAVRRLVGICKQFEYLYPKLSAKEHLEIFGGIRGVPADEIGATVQKWLESVDLLIVQDHFSSSFSGGMKRRLSLACATIGNRPLIILDEPTTGMDPVSRRFVWKHIDEIKDGRCVLLTTHAMEEADLLADTVAVMRSGELAAFGTPLELKTEHGSALQFTLLVDKAQLDNARQSIASHFEGNEKWVDVTAGEAGNITVKIESVKRGEVDGVDVGLLAGFVAWLEDKDKSHVDEFGISNSSLEEVFLKVTGDTSGNGNGHDEDLDEVKVCCGSCRCCCCRPRRQQPAAAAELVAEVNEETDVETAAVDTSDIAAFEPNLTVMRQTRALLRFTVLRAWVGRGSIVNWFALVGIGIGIVMVGLSAGNGYDFAPYTLTPTLGLSLMLLIVVFPIYKDRDLSAFYLLRSQGLLKNSFLLANGVYALVMGFFFAALFLSLWYLSPIFRRPEFCPWTAEYGWEYCWDYTRFGKRRLEVPTWIEWDDTYEGQQVQLYATWTGGSFARILGTVVAFALTMPGGVLASSYLPGFKLATASLVVVVIMVSILPMILYYTSQLDYQASLECQWNVCNITLDSFDIDNVSDQAPEFLDCVALNIHSGSIGSFCMPPHAAILPQFGIFLMTLMTLFSDVLLVSDPPGYVEDVLIPALGGSVNCDGSSCRFPFAASYYGQAFGYMVVSAVILGVMGYLFVSVFSYPDGIILQLRHKVIRTWKSARLLCTCSLKSTAAPKNDKQSDDNGPFEEVVAEKELVTSILDPYFSKPQGQIDHDALPRDDLPPIIASSLRKVYPGLGGAPPKTALDSLYLEVPKGQVLGLLGKNGAGKTTALRIFSVSHEASSGVALVAGYDVASEEINVYERMGTCPQFDIVWPGQSVQRHLELFASIKGLPTEHVPSIARSIAKAVGLGSADFYKRKAGDLSGGMRRRLSIAISLIGAPKVLLLDEPSTGLDPSTRNSIWKLVNSFATSDRAVIITTHMMLEADTLCNRIAIMSHGHLKVIGTQQNLKDRFGSGYLLQLNLVKSTLECQESAMDFVKSRLHPHAVLQTKQAKTLHVALPQTIKLEDVFRVLYSEESATKGGINQFLISQSSLEDVFIALGD